MKAKGRKPDFVKVAGETVEGLYYDKGLNVYYYYTVDPTTNKKRKITRRNKAKAALDLYNYKLQQEETIKVKVPFDFGRPINTKLGIDPKGRTSIQRLIARNVATHKGNQVDLVEDIPAIKIPENAILESFVEMLDNNMGLVADE